MFSFLFFEFFPHKSGNVSPFDVDELDFSLYNVFMHDGRCLMAKVKLTIDLDEELNEQAEKVFSNIGLSVESAITLFIKQSVQNENIPFDIATDRTISYSSDKDIETASARIIEENIIAYEELAK